MMVYRRRGNGALFTVFPKTAESPLSHYVTSGSTAQVDSGNRRETTRFRHAPDVRVFGTPPARYGSIPRGHHHSSISIATHGVRR